MNLVALLCTILLLYSCGTSIVVSPTGCDTEGMWGKKVSTPDFVIEETVWSPIGFLDKQHVNIMEVLKRKRIRCSQLSRLSVTVHSSWQDVLRSIIPFAATRSVVIAGSYIYRPDLLSMDGGVAGTSHDE